MKEKTILAHWDGEQYVTEESSGWDWRSDDGSTWVTGDGIECDSDEFYAARIHLIGGPFDNQIVD